MRSKLHFPLMPVAFLALAGCSTAASMGQALKPINPSGLTSTPTLAPGANPTGANAACAAKNEPILSTKAVNAKVGAQTDIASLIKARLADAKADLDVGVDAEVMARVAASSPANFLLQSKMAADSSSGQASTTNAPPDISAADFFALAKFLRKIKGSGKRVEYYELAYFQGKFINRFGASLKPAELSAKNQDQEIANLVTVFMEAILDEYEEQYD